MMITSAGAPLDLTGLTSADLLREGQAHQEGGDLDGAIARFRAVAENFQGSPECAIALYQWSWCLELKEDFTEALAHYDTFLATYPNDPVSTDVWFRRALVLEALGRSKEAVASLRHVHADALLLPRDEWTLRLQRGISLLRSGRTRKGLRIVDDSLDYLVDVESLAWLRSKAYIARGEVWAAQAEAYDFQTSPDKQARQLEARALLIQKLEGEVTQVTLLRQPGWILWGMLLIGQSYESLYQDLRKAPPPSGYSEETLADYDATVAERTLPIVTKAWNYYDQGVSLAERVMYEGQPLPQLRAARDAINLSELVEERDQQPAP